MCRRSELTALVHCPLRCWCHGTVALYQTRWLEMSTKATCFTQRASLCYKNGRLACQTSEMSCVLIFSFIIVIALVTMSCGFTKVGKLNHVSPQRLCCRRDGPSIMCSESDRQHIAAVLTIQCRGCCEIVGCVCHMSPPFAEHQLILSTGLPSFFSVSLGAMLVNSLGFFLFAKGFLLHGTGGFEGLLDFFLL